MQGARGAAPRAGRPLWLIALAVIVGGVFIYAGVLKAWDPLKFAEDIQNFHIVNWQIGVRLAFFLPWLEIVCGLALIFGFLRSGAVAILTGLMLVFIGGTIAAKARGIDLSCGCFGAASKDLTFASHLAIDFALLAGLAALWLFSPRAART
jgi:uncharacterized membrane protein YphA (DoxX/SURF4 family)